MTNTEYLKLGNKIRYFRKRAGLSQMQLELEINAAAGMISRIESGEVNPLKETLIKIAATLNLSDRERDYLYGSSANPATDEEIGKALGEVNFYFNKFTTLAYLLDERHRVVDVSKSFMNLLGLDEAFKDKYYKRSFISLLLDKELNLKAFIEEQSYEDVLYHLFKRFYAEVGFMVDDPVFREAETSILSDTVSLKIWEKVKTEPVVGIHLPESRKIDFKFGPLKISMYYFDEPLPKYRRFEIVEYLPSNKLLKYLKKII